jgi:hypothetical protein
MRRLVPARLSTNAPQHDLERTYVLMRSSSNHRIQQYRQISRSLYTSIARFAAMSGEAGAVARLARRYQFEYLPVRSNRSVLHTDSLVATGAQRGYYGRMLVRVALRARHRILARNAALLSSYVTTRRVVRHCRSACSIRFLYVLCGLCGRVDGRQLALLTVAADLKRISLVRRCMFRCSSSSWRDAIEMSNCAERASGDAFAGSGVCHAHR